MDILKFKFWIMLFFVTITIFMLGAIIYLLLEDSQKNQIYPNVQINTPDFNGVPKNFSSARFLFLPITGFLGMLAGAIIFYFMANRVNKNINTQKKNTRIILNFLSPSEKKVIETLMSNNGQAFQYELNRITGLSRVKTHRILENLEAKGIITKEKYGKINKVILNKELFEVLKLE